MTLFKQIALLVSLVFLLLVTVITIGDVRRSSEYLGGQLQTSAQDIATTLAISISNSAISQDIASLETLFNSVFDSGYYTRIAMIGADNEIIHKKEQETEIRQVPAWFISLISLQEATGTSQVMQGWIPVGTLSITVHPGFAYVNLYQALKATLVWVISLFVVGLILLWVLLHKLMQPLEQVRRQAEAIHANQFVQQSALPSTPELRRVVETMNRMVAKVQSIFSDQQNTLANYHNLLYIDDLSGLGNRKYLINQIEQARSEDSLSYTAMAILKLHGLSELKDGKGYQAADSLICLVAKLLKKHCVVDSDEKCARLSEDEFAILESKDTDVLIERINAFFKGFREQSGAVIQGYDISLVAGVVHLHADSSTSDILSDLDYAVTQALSKGPYSVAETTHTKLRLPHGKMQWRSWLEKSLADGRLYLASQPVFDKQNKAIQQEVFVRLKNEQDETVPAGLFMPMALSLGFGLEIDRAVFKLLRQAAEVNRDIPVALNLTASFLANHSHISQEFSELLAYFENLSSGLCLEVSHNVFNQYPQMCMQIADRVRHLDHNFGIDNLDLKMPLDVLQSIRPDYVKVNANTLMDLTPEEMSSAYQALKTMINTLDIRLIAVAVESQEVYDRLLKLGVEAMQGNLLAEPKELL